MTTALATLWKLLQQKSGGFQLPSSNQIEDHTGQSFHGFLQRQEGSCQNPKVPCRKFHSRKQEGKGAREEESQSWFITFNDLEWRERRQIG